MQTFQILLIIAFTILFLLCVIPRKWYPSRLVTYKRKTTYPNKFSIVPKKEIDTVYEKVFEPRDISELTEQGTANLDLINDIHNYLIDLEPLEIQVKKTPLESIISDSQNVHDSYIQSGLSKDYVSPKKDKLTDSDKMNSILEYSGWDPDIEKAVCRIKKRNTEMTKYNDDTEFDILWDTFNSGCENVKNQLLVVLKSLQLSEFLPCPTGVVSQIRESIFINEPEKAPVHQPLLQQCMLNKASVLAKEPGMTSRIISDKLIAEYKSIYPEKDLRKIIDEWGTICEQ